MVVQYKDMCFDCGRKQYTIRDEKALNGITGKVGTCSECGTEETFIVYATDWAGAEDSNTYPEKYD